MSTPFSSLQHRYGALLLTLILGGIGAFGLQAARAQEVLLADIDRVYPEEVKADGFVLKARQEVQIEAVGPVTRRKHFGLSNAWILDAETREVAWVLDEADYEVARGVRDASEVLSLPAGAYEVYYAAFPYRPEYEDQWVHQDDDEETLDKALAFLRRANWNDWREWHDWKEAYEGGGARRFGLTIRGTGDGYREPDPDRLAEVFTRDALLSFTSLRHNRYLQQGFALTAPTDLALYALGELRREGEYDYAWIIDVDTRERVWSMDYRNTDHAGGADKNRVHDATVRLPVGRYALFVVTDDSHSPEDWNSAPPFDPTFWGLTVRVPLSQRAAVSLFDYEHVPLESAFLAFRRVGDGAYHTEGFTLKAPMAVRLYALGEGRDGRMFDYGWIVDASTRKEVWRMDYYDTDHAGGGDKNRLVDDMLRLPAGNYVAHYVSDDSHSYEDWNTNPPYDQDAWGLTLLPAEASSDPDNVSSYDEADDPAVIAQLIRMRDDDEDRLRFTLEADADVQVYALGEGTGGRMYDYGWIEDATTGKVVWEMTYRMTDHAGGGDKNRLVDATLSLRAGSYVLFYKTDGSHAFGDWNTPPPHNPAYWGITLRRAR